MFTKQIVLKQATQDRVYTKLCNIMEKQGVFMACGSCDDKWVMGKWENEIDFLAWCVAMGMGMATPTQPPTSSNSN